MTLFGVNAVSGSRSTPYRARRKTMLSTPDLHLKFDVLQLACAGRQAARVSFGLD